MPRDNDSTNLSELIHEAKERHREKLDSALKDTVDQIFPDRDQKCFLDDTVQSLVIKSEEDLQRDRETAISQAGAKAENDAAAQFDKEHDIKPNIKAWERFIKKLRSRDK